MSELQKHEPEDEVGESHSTTRRGEIWSKIGLTAASALLGGVAVALFNRQILHAIQQKLNHRLPPPQDDDIY
jgi:hypothetical protein